MNEITVKTENFLYDGNTIAKINGKTVLIPYSMPNETLTIKIVETKKDYDIAKIITIEEPSANRVSPKCKYYTKCGGCNMMHINQDYQRELKKNILIDLFAQNNIDAKNLIETLCDKDTNYRSRFQFTDGGLSEKATNNIIKIDECLCAEPIINDYLKSNSQLFPNGRIHLFGSEKIIGTDKVIICNNEKTTPSVKNNHEIKNYKSKHYFSGTILNDNSIVEIELLNKKISFDVRGFFHSNLSVFEKVLKLILNSLPEGKNVLDMYAGCGSISTFLSDKYENVTLVEHNRDALVFAETNMSGKKHTSYGMSGASWCKNCASSCGKFDAIVIDPPRSGIEKEVINYLTTIKSPYIRYLSCNPSTQARDIKKLISNGYKLEKLYLLDFYPNTSHIESLAILNLDI